MPLPVPYLLVIAVVLGVGLVFLWSAKTRVTAPPPPVAMVMQRIAFPGGVQVHDPQSALVRVERPDEIVIPFEQAVLVIDYPLSHPASIPITAPLPLGFTRASLIQTICEEYAQIYEAEEGTANTKTIPIEERGPRPARNRTDGAYGIWGHDLQDLVLTAAHWTREADGTVKIQLHIQR
ncbi:MAG: hypothetical protein JWO36_6540 [Myxococcales bacterium]|nr:hypothetical protein [Myxococcales bacterium]